MTRRLLSLLTALSLLLCVAAAAMWVRSYWVSENWRWDNDGKGIERSLYSMRGQLSFYRASYDPVAMASVAGRPAAPPDTPVHFVYRRFANSASLAGRVQVLLSNPSGRAYGPRYGLALFLFWPDGYGIHHVEVMAPYWLVTLPLAAPPLLWLRSRRKRRGRMRGRVCIRCGYDLRATPERCPECGFMAPVVG